MYILCLLAQCLTYRKCVVNIIAISAHIIFNILQSASGQERVLHKVHAKLDCKTPSTAVRGSRVSFIAPPQDFPCSGQLQPHQPQFSHTHQPLLQTDSQGLDELSMPCF